MEKASAFVWKTARCQDQELPDCPADMTEPEYANLLFYSRCQAVGNMRKRFSGTCVAGIVQAAETDGFALFTHALASFSRTMTSLWKMISPFAVKKESGLTKNKWTRLSRSTIAPPFVYQELEGCGESFC
ncbi:hypothetical protein HD554DRAFT_2118440 [Boletus coccyginus]|nr:hypothetical protein HD554DRAFT_2118440 [Boletus coccyginus]